MVVGIDAATLAQRHPILYHMAADGSWPSILRHGLLSTSSLLDLFAYKGAEREALETRHRPESVPIHHSELGVAIIRDQKPMSDAGLVRSLGGVPPADWYRLLNSLTFFWLTEERLHRMLNARAYRDQAHVVLHVDTAEMLARHEGAVRLSPMNSGATKPFAWPRSPAMFRDLAGYPYADRVRRSGASNAIVEFAVQGGVADIGDLGLRVARMRGSAVIDVIHDASG